MRPLVYISGPISLGDRVHNLSQSFVAFRELVEAGFSPVNPMTSMLYAFLFPMEHKDWMELDLPLVCACDAVLRLPGESRGADLEVECALRQDPPIPVCSSVGELKILFSMKGNKSGEGSS